MFNELNCRFVIKVAPWIFVLVFLVHYESYRLDLLWKQPQKTEPSLEYQLSHDVTVSFDQLMASPLFIKQDDPRLIQQIVVEYLHPPSTDPYNLIANRDDPSVGQAQYIRSIFRGQGSGFFVECGAQDGESRSNTLLLEKLLGWKGLLIEGDPINFEMLRQKNRKAWSVGACLSISPYPTKLMFRQDFDLGRVASHERARHKVGMTEVQCLPLYSILLALNTTNVDFFSLDVEGDELKILKTIPWEIVNIKALSVEYIHTEEGKAALKNFIISKGYFLNKTIANDFVFLKKDFMPQNWV